MDKIPERLCSKNLAFLQETWPAFLAWLGKDCWWRNISYDEIRRYMRSDAVPVGSIIVSQCLVRHTGGVCSITLKCATVSVQLGHVYIQKGRYITVYEPVCSCQSLIQIVSNICEFHVGTKKKFIPVPPNLLQKYQYGPFNVTVDAVLQQVKNCQLLQNTTIRTLTTVKCSVYKYDHILRDMHIEPADEDGNTPAVLVDLQEETTHGYLFSILTQCGIHMVRFRISGFVFKNTHHSLDFPDLQTLLQFALNTCKSTHYLDNGMHSLRSWCRYTLARRKVPLHSLPPSLRHYVESYNGPQLDQQSYLAL